MRYVLLTCYFFLASFAYGQPVAVPLEAGIARDAEVDTANETAASDSQTETVPSEDQAWADSEEDEWGEIDTAFDDEFESVEIDESDR